MKTKIYNKAKCFHKHGKHGGMRGIAAGINRQKKLEINLEKIDLQKPNWSAK